MESTDKKSERRLDIPAPILVSDHPAIDFLNSRAVPVDVEVEWLGKGSALIAWLRAAGLIDDEDATQCANLFERRSLDLVAGEARALREWLRGFVRERAGRPIGPRLSDKALDPINRLLAEGESHWRIERATSSARMPMLKRRRRWTEPRQLLQPIADAIADLITQADFELIRSCSGKGCTLMFLDKTKSHRRRWCSMAVCGNRAKAAGHREKVRREHE